MLSGGSATTANDFVRDIFVFNTPLNAATNVDQIVGFQANSQDPDGSGGGAKVFFAWLSLSSAGTVDVTDFTVSSSNP